MSMQDLSAQQLKQTIDQLHVAANATGNSAAYQKNLLNWSTSTATPRGGGTGRTTRSRNTPRATPAASTPVPQPAPVIYPQQAIPPPVFVPVGPPNPPANPIPVAAQGYYTTYPSRMRTGVSLLMQPIISHVQATTSRSSRRAVNYVDPGSGDDLPDAGALDSDDSEFQNELRAPAGARQRAAVTKSRMAPGMSVFNSNTGVTAPVTAPTVPLRPEKTELDQSYLGLTPPARFVQTKVATPALKEGFHVFPTQDKIDTQAVVRSALVPIRVEFETDTHRIRDCFVWNLNEDLIRPENFAAIFCADLDLPTTWVETVTNQIRAQLEEHEAIARLELSSEELDQDEPAAECRVILSIDVQIATHHLLDHIEWDLLSPLTPEDFSQTLCRELGLAGEAVPLIAHAIHEELIKHKKDAVEWGVVDGGGMRDKTGLGMSSGSRGRGPKPLESVWRDWQEADEFRTRFEILSADEVERREIERERASRRLRRETSKFQSSRRRRF
ncbi:unnamed protein product [Mycena citricolor]|uniref:SNF5-domain-containing protein n=1 Tax=Mycena citricolor TaxID=2018698 RepID=A0AAD2H897_9AGAR|nr:unnamed protein product [Mycena citricolor]